MTEEKRFHWKESLSFIEEHQDSLDKNDIEIVKKIKHVLNNNKDLHRHLEDKMNNLISKIIELWR